MRKLLIFSASWCNPCKQLKEVMRVPVELNVDQITTIDVDDWKEVAKEHNVRSVPTLIILDNDVEVKRKSGAMTREQLVSFCQ